jgi:uncharacterized protein YjbJ (UPF0337 family)
MANDDDENRGKLDNIKGRVKQAAGALTGNKRVEAEGAVERVKGAAEEALEKAKRKIKDEDEEDDEDKE